jgi:hypothetical protein
MPTALPTLVAPVRLRSMTASSGWNAVLAALLTLALVPFYRPGTAGGDEVFFLLALVMWHGIYAIWFAKGRHLPQFARATVPGRVLISGWYATTAVVIALHRDDANVPPGLVTVFLGYLVLQSAADLAGACWTGLELRGAHRPGGSEPGGSEPGGSEPGGSEPGGSELGGGLEPGEPASARWERRNRLVFAVVMIVIAAWILVDTSGFLSFFRLPESGFSVSGGASSTLPGPLLVLAPQILLLAGYNLVAVRYHLHPLIEAGVRGGLFAFTSFAVLVAAGLLSARTLLLVGADLLSVAVILASRAGGHVVQQETPGHREPPP